MATYFQGLRKTSFGGIEFPAEGITLYSRGRQHVHEFPHQPSGAPEKLGRGIWCLTVRANFSREQYPGYPNLYPQRMAQLRLLYEQQATATFVHPTSGEFQAFITSWKQVYEPGRIQSGEKVDIEYIEDQALDFLTSSAQASNSLSNSADDLARQLKAVQVALAPTEQEMSGFQAVQGLVNGVLAIGDQLGLYSQLYVAKVTSLVGLCQQIDSYASLNNNPVAVGVVDALHELWAQAQQLSLQVTSQQSLSEWIVDHTMTLQDIAIRLYGDASRQDDLLTLNATVISDPFAVRPGTRIHYFPPSAQPSAAPF